MDEQSQNPYTSPQSRYHDKKDMQPKASPQEIDYFWPIWTVGSVFSAAVLASLLLAALIRLST